MFPSYASNTSARANRSGVSQPSHPAHPYSLRSVIPGQSPSGSATHARHAIGTEFRGGAGPELGTELRTSAGHALRHDLRNNISTMLGARLAPRRAVATSQDLGTSGNSATSSTRANARHASDAASSHTPSRISPQTASHAAPTGTSHAAPHAMPSATFQAAPHAAAHVASRAAPHNATRAVRRPPNTDVPGHGPDAASRLRQRLLSDHDLSSLRPRHAGRHAAAPPISNTDISAPHRYRALSEHCAMMIVADQARQHQFSAPTIAELLTRLARTLESDAPHAQRLLTLRNFRAVSQRSPHPLEQQRAISRILMGDYLAARYLSDPVTNVDTLAVEIGERRTELEHQLRMSPVYSHLKTLQHCLNLHGPVQQLREKCAVAFLHAYVTRQNTMSACARATTSHAAVHTELLQYQGFVFARDAIISTPSCSLASVRLMGEADAPLHLGPRAANVHQVPAQREQTRTHRESNTPSRPHHILSHQLTAQIFKMYAKRTGLVMLATKMEDPALPLETRLTYLQGFLGSVLPEAGQRVPTLIRIYAGLRYFSDPLCTQRIIALELGCEESVAQASLDNMPEFRQLRDLSALWNGPEDRLMLRERCAQSLLNAACDAQTSDERIHPDVPGSAYIAETTTLYRALNNILRDEQCFRDWQRDVIDQATVRDVPRR